MRLTDQQAHRPAVTLRGIAIAATIAVAAASCASDTSDAAAPDSASDSSPDVTVLQDGIDAAAAEYPLQAIGAPLVEHPDPSTPTVPAEEEVSADPAEAEVSELPAGGTEISPGAYAIELGDTDAIWHIPDTPRPLKTAFSGPNFRLVTTGSPDDRPSEQETLLFGQSIGWFDADSAVQLFRGPPTADRLVHPEDIGAHLATLEGIMVTDSGTLTSGGIPVQWWDVIINPDAPPGTTFDCAGEVGPPGGACVNIIAYGAGGFSADPEIISRIYQFENHDTVAIAYVQPEAFPAWSEHADQLVMGLHLDAPTGEPAEGGKPATAS